MDPQQTLSRDDNMGSGDGFIKQQAIPKAVIKQKESQSIKILRRILTCIPYQILITLLTLYSLFADDIRIVATPKTADVAFDGMGIALICIFTIEIMLSSFAIDKYFGSFFFVLDIISTLSLLFDVSLFTNLVYSSSFSSYTFSQVAAQSKASRAAIRAVRIVKLFRIIRIVKLYKVASKADQINMNRKKEQMIKQKLRLKFEKNIKNNEQQTIEKFQLMAIDQSQNLKQSKGDMKIYPVDMIHNKRASKINFPHLSQQSMAKDNIIQNNPLQEVDSLIEADQIEQANKNESKIRKIMSDITLKKVIIVVLLLMFIAPLFDPDIYLDAANSLDFTLQSLNRMIINTSNGLTVGQINTIINGTITDLLTESNYIIYLSTPFNEIQFYSDPNFNDFRVSDYVVSALVVNTTNIMAARPGMSLNTSIVDPTVETTFLAMLNNRQYNQNQSYMNICKTLFVCFMLVILLHFFNNDIQTLIVKPIEAMMEKLKVMAADPESASKQKIDKNTHFQTTIISNAIVKIGALLSIVFGSAGAQIIGKNIVQQGDMNPMLQGKKKCAIFGFCDIRKFNDINQILEEDILLFVNKISSVVHKAVYRYGGSANKNIGQAFLLVWKIPEGNYSINNANNEITWYNKQHLSVVADYSVYSFIKTLVKINKLPQILEYRNNQLLLQKLPNYKVEMGFGLHIGWAIEGAIGSEFKIDASYLSPNVNMASRLEAATKQFGVNFLISQSLYDVLTPNLQNYCRNIDRVTVKGSNKPLKLYTVDMNLDMITPPADKVSKYPNIPDYQPDIQLKRQINLQFLHEDTIKDYDAQKFIQSKKQFRQVLVNAVTPEFKKAFAEGLKTYLTGNWADAKLHFTHALKIHNNDGPTKRLLSYMKNFQFIAPETWNNFRQLTSK